MVMRRHGFFTSWKALRKLLATKSADPDVEQRLRLLEEGGMGNNNGMTIKRDKT